MADIAYLDKKDLVPEGDEASQLKTYYDERHKTGWFLMNGAPRPAFTPTLLKSISDYFKSVKQEMHESQAEKYDYLVLASDVEGVFNFGGDLNLFREYIQNNDKAALLEYALHCIDLVYQNHSHLNVDLTTISLIQGDALGGGFEAAVSANVVIAERGTKLGLPETLFNLFPGMGAYSILSRKVGPSMAEKMILSGKLYTAEELFEIGVIDILADEGEGELAVYAYINNAKRASNTHRSMRMVRDICHPIKYQELRDVAAVWVDAALRLRERDLKMMQRLVNRQSVK